MIATNFCLVFPFIKPTEARYFEILKIFKFLQVLIFKNSKFVQNYF
jgi:hypothetical protein